MSNIRRSGDVAILQQSRSIFEKKALTNPRDLVTPGTTPSAFLESPYFRDYFYAGSEQIIPDGPDNLFPYRWKGLIETDSIMPGMLRQRIDLMLAGQTVLYSEVMENGEIVKKPMLNNEIRDWLESWDFYNYLIEQATDFIYLERIATKMIPNMFRRLTSEYNEMKKIAMLQRVPIEDVRMGPHDANYQVRDYYLSNWLDWKSGVTKIPAYNKMDPFAAPQSIYYEKMPSFCSKYYGRPSTIGVANYLNLKLLILNNTEDFIINAPFRFHIESPFEYWQKVQETNNWDLTQLEAYEDQMLADMDNFLKASDGRNAMKRFHTKYNISDYSKERLGWRITPISDDSEKRMDSNFKGFEKINENIIAATSLDPSLSNIQITGKLSSGLDKLIAFNMHQLTNTPTPRRKILAAVNEAIKINFWKGDFRPVLGFENLQLQYQTKATGGNDDSN